MIPIAKRRLEVDLEADATETVALAEAVRRLLAAQRNEHLLETVRASGEIERAARAITARALLAADGVLSRRALGEAYGTAHDAINRRLAAAKEHDTTEHE